MVKETNQISIFDPAPDTQMYEYKMSVEKLQSELSKYGLTSNQSKVFIYLGKYGSKTAPEVCKALKLPRTETYHLLSALQNKGVVTATFQHPIQFKALPLDKAIWILVNSEKERVKGLEMMEKDLSELWKNIPDFDSVEESTEDKFQMLQGANQIHSKITEMTDNFKEEFLILGSEKDFLKLYHGDFLEQFIKSKQQFRILSSCTSKTLYIFDDIERKNIKSLSKEIQNNLCFILKDNSELLFFTKNANNSDEPFAMWTDSPALVYSMKLLFESQWSTSKNIHL
ncbi:TrmB family transcriptional regulator [Nitrosopumilus sp. K4]|uniref:TrmB family transcriptional regulator n=1 Tax=Nitrosopumilus sp. K4 TaxID=2795383 RepID=UPI001BA68446|nr:helix-turn-helix domain-containing protein [Nitrosopumilus sp. K4]QUC65451.1 TrmB family transcriptional regulator [Nitrosopumilus sp. K4]